MRSRDGTNICVTCKSTNTVPESNINGMEEQSTASSSNDADISEASSVPSKRPRVLQDSYEKFSLPNDVWRNESVPRLLRKTVQQKLSWASSRLLVDSITSLKLLESCINLLTIMEVDLSDAPEYMITMLNLEKFVESEQKRLADCFDLHECNRICDLITSTLRVMKSLDQAVTKLNRL